MSWDANTQLSLAAVVMAGLSLAISLFSAFPGMKGLITVVRDGVLWLALLVVLSGVGFVVYQRLQQTPSVTQRSSFDALPSRTPAPFITESR
jgi:hypothetical protein